MAVSDSDLESERKRFSSIAQRTDKKTDQLPSENASTEQVCQLKVNTNWKKKIYSALIQSPE